MCEDYVNLAKMYEYIENKCGRPNSSSTRPFLELHKLWVLDFFTIGPKSVDNALCILSRSCRAESWNHRCICNCGFTADSSVVLCIFINDYDAEDPDMGVGMWIHQMI